ncbi:MAG: DUF4254 domain-containing protein [Bacteroidales bacterium]|nr:DUF4254 domain-containing protein [Bacteroidales bacterium]
MNTQQMYALFERQIIDYHIADSVDAPLQNPFAEGTEEVLLWEKSWVDTVQWHLEDLIRPADVDPVEALRLKRRIDASNQRRTDLVEQIDDRFMARFRQVKPLPEARINTETPAWAIDRLSILALKIYHFGIEAQRGDEQHRQRCQAKLDTLLVQRTDLVHAIDWLLDDLAAGRRVMRLYRQMKMYNDPSLNPMLYGAAPASASTPQ